MIQFDLRIFFKGVGEKPPTSYSTAIFGNQNTFFFVKNPGIFCRVTQPICFSFFFLFFSQRWCFFTPPKTNMEPKNWWFVDVSPFPRGYFQVPCLFSGVYIFSWVGEKFYGSRPQGLEVRSFFANFSDII